MQFGVLLALTAYGIFACADAIIKSFGDTMSVFQMAFTATAFSTIPVLVTKPRDEPLREIFHARRAWLLHLRGALRVGAQFCVFTAFTSIALAQAYALLFLTPVFVTILSVFILREDMTGRRWLLLLLGFAGVLLVVRPGFQTLEFGHLTALCGAGFAAAGAITLRVASTEEKRTSVIAHAVAWSLVANGVLMLPEFIAPSMHQLGLLAAIGLLGGTGHLLMVSAMKNATANLLAPTQYSQLIWATVLGAVFFAEFPDTVTFAGLGLIVASGIIGVPSARARTWFGVLPFLRRGER